MSTSALLAALGLSLNLNVAEIPQGTTIPQTVVLAQSNWQLVDSE